MKFDPQWLDSIRAEFPQLKREVRGRPLIYLDNAATTLKTRGVIEAVHTHLSEGASNVHRGAHFLSDAATELFEQTRERARAFINAESKNEIIFTRGCTDGLNLLAHSLSRVVLEPDDEILLSQMEHHSNIVPWQIVAKERGAKVRFAPVLEDGTLDLAAYKQMLSPRTKIVSLVHLSNALGTLNPLKEFFAAAHAVGALTVADAAQSAASYPLDVQAMGADFLVLSGHKMFATTGVGFLYGRYELLDRLPPYQGGGSMISEVSESETTYLPPPHRFEAGTPAIAEVIGFGRALEFIQSLGVDELRAHEHFLMQVVEDELGNLPGLRRIGRAPERSHVFSFLLDGAHPSDVGAILDEQSIAVRAGHHCCQPLMKRLGIPGTTRASFSVYTSEADVRAFARGVRKAKELLS